MTRRDLVRLARVRYGIHKPHAWRARDRFGLSAVPPGAIHAEMVATGVSWADVAKTMDKTWPRVRPRRVRR